ncbi:MAG: VWA domain-containing protein [Gammaproteobacteria bacterium]|nr:VWA domain-containing protein [Gammaproteobacteria bacterium]
MLADFHFLRPEWLLALPFVIAVAILFARRRLGPGSWENVVDEQLAPHVLSGAQAKRSDHRWLLLGLSGVLGVAALAGPAWQRIEQPVFRSDQSLVVALDLSRSMDAQDVSPSRLARARLKILDLLERRASGQTALVVYSSNAFTVTPLTTDTDTVAALVNSLDTDIMPSRGSYPIAAINKGRKLLDQASVSVGEVLLISDGGSSPATERIARDLLAAGYTLSVLGVGTTQGAPIPRATGGFVTDQSGRIAVPRLEETSLRALAVAGGGRYAVLTSDSRDLDYLLSGEVGPQRASDESQTTDQWHEEGPYILLLLLPLAALAFRRGWLLVVVIVILPITEPAHASLWDELWRNNNQQAQNLLEDGDPAAAAELFEDDEWRAVSRYRAGDYARSAAEFAEREDARNLYNLGNALALQGEFESAIDAYEQVLEIDADDVDAAYNRDLLRAAMEQQQNQQGDQQQSSETPGGDSEESDRPPDPNQQADDDAQSDSDSNDGDPSQRPEDESTEEDLQALQEELRRAAEQAEQQQRSEQTLTEAELAELRRLQAEQQALEQWLRRIPNDPGGLLRRKFRYQYQRMGKDQDGNNLWPDNEAQPW